MKRPSGPAAQLVAATIARDLPAFKAALVQGADPFNAEMGVGTTGTVTVQMVGAYRINAIQCLLRLSHPLSFLRAVDEAGRLSSSAWQNALEWSIAYGNEQAMGFLLENRADKPLETRHWLACFKARKPHRLLAKMLSIAPLPKDQDLRCRLVASAVRVGSLAAMEQLVQQDACTLPILVQPAMVAAGSQTPQAYCWLLDRLLRDRPGMVEDYRVQGLGVLHAFLRNNVHLREDSLEVLLSHPSLRAEIEVQCKETLPLCLALFGKHEHPWKVLLAAGARFPAARPEESQEAYFERIRPAGLPAMPLRRSIEAWVCLQAQQMEHATPPAPLFARASRRL